MFRFNLKSTWKIETDVRSIHNRTLLTDRNQQDGILYIQVIFILNSEYRLTYII